MIVIISIITKQNNRTSASTMSYFCDKNDDSIAWSWYFLRDWDMNSADHNTISSISPLTKLISKNCYNWYFGWPASVWRKIDQTFSLGNIWHFWILGLIMTSEFNSWSLTNVIFVSPIFVILHYDSDPPVCVTLTLQGEEWSLYNYPYQTSNKDCV